MSSSRTESVAIANRYATAMFELAVEAKAQAALVADFRTLANAVQSSEELQEVLKNPLLSSDKKSDVLQALAGKMQSLTQQSLATLATQGRAEQLPYVADALEAMLAEHENTVIAEVTSARPLTPAIEKQLADSLKKATGKQVTMHMHQDPAVLGGVAIRIGSHLLDATLAGALSSIRTKLLVPTQ